MDKIKVAVLFGGMSTEHEVSCVSAYSVIKGFDQKKFCVVTVGLAGLICFMACIFIGITTKSLYGKNYIGIYEKMNKKPETVVTYYESKGFLLVSSKCSFEGNYQTGEVD